MFPDWLPIEAFPELKNYRDFQKMTEGGFAEIFTALCWSEGVRTPVVFKRLRPLFARDPEHRALFENEARILKRLSHPQIPHFFDGFLSEGECFIIMEQVKGRDPAQLMRNAKSMGRDFPWEIAFFTVIQIAAVLDYLHHYREESGETNPLLHCDIKPHNFLIAPEPKVYLIDFSVATFLKNAKPHMMGTTAFMPPERLGAQEFSLQTDLLPLSLSLYYLITQEPLIPAKKMTELFGSWLSEKYLAGIRDRKFPQALEEFFLTNLSLRPGSRAPSAQDLSRQLSECARALGLDISETHAARQYRELETIR